jgi:hypothetical protein
MTTDKVMGTMDEAKAKFMTAVDAWLALRQPMMGTAKALRQMQARETEARFQLANAAALLAYAPGEQP